MRRDQIVKHDHRRRLQIILRGERIPRRRLPVVIAVDEDEGPAPPGRTEANDLLRTGAGNEIGAIGLARAIHRRDKFAIPFRLAEQRLDDIERLQDDFGRQG